MTTQVALLRAVNVGGGARVTMSDLRKFVAELGFGDVRSVLQSGNLVFEETQNSGPALERLLEAEAARRLSLHTEFLLRTAQEWAQLVRRNPFLDAARLDPARLVVMLLKRAPDADGVLALKQSVTGPEIIEVLGRELYIVYPDGIGRSALPHRVVEAKLATRGTGRNWNTVLRLADLARG